MKSLVQLHLHLLDDLGIRCSVHTERDKQYVLSRSKHEGIEFFSITLSNFVSDIEKSLERGWITSDDFVGFKKSGCLPCFMKGFTRYVFDASGAVKENDDEGFVTALYCIRQFCRFSRKLLRPCRKAKVKAAFDKYLATDHDLVCPRGNMPSDRYDHFRTVARTLWSSCFDGEYDYDLLIPRHGPGATAERISGNQKYVIKGWHERLEKSFPYSEFGVPSISAIESPDDIPEYKCSKRETPVRVITVPKTAKTPRIIAIEPVCMQYTQQALMRYMVKRIASHYSGASIRFDDQTVNQKMAIKASKDRSHSTLDLSEASDRVPVTGVVDMLRSIPWLLKAILACRTMRASVPKPTKKDRHGRETIKLRKFASMGSALCFPIESMYFYTVILSAGLQARGLQITPSNLRLIGKEVYVFGDDIIVPTDLTDTVMESLTQFGAKVNHSKSFWKSHFRESCGADAYRGEVITPVYLRRMVPIHRRDSSGIISAIATSNQLHKNGCWKAAAYIRERVEKLLGPLPVVAESSPGLGWVSFLGVDVSAIKAYDWEHQVPLVRTYKLRAQREPDAIEDYPALMKSLLNLGTEKEVDHLEYSSRHCAVSSKRSWVRAD